MSFQGNRTLQPFNKLQGWKLLARTPPTDSTLKKKKLTWRESIPHLKETFFSIYMYRSNAYTLK